MSTAIIYELIGRDNVSPAFRSAGRSADDASGRFARLGKAMEVAGTAMAGAAAVVAVKSVEMAVTFQGQMEKIRTQAGASQKSVQALTADVLKMAPSAQQGPQQLAEALYHLKSLGMDNVAAMKALRTASDLAAVGGANLEDTATAIGAAWRSGIKGGQSFGQTAATVNAIIGAGNMKMGDFVDALSSGVLPAARTFGVSLKSVGAAMALMTDEGIPAQLAATRLRMSLSLLGAPSAQASKWLATIGLTGTQLGNAMRSPGGLIAAVSLLKKHLDDSGLSASQSAQLISRAFGGGQSSSAIMTMLNNLNVLKKKQDQINQSVGNYGSDVTAQRKTAQAQFDLLKSTVDTLGIRIGLALLPPITKFVTYLNAHGLPDLQKAIKWVTSPDVRPWAKIAGEVAGMALGANLVYGALKKAAALTGLDKVAKAVKSTGTSTATTNMGTAAKIQLDASKNMLKAAGVQADAAGVGKTGAAAGAAEGAAGAGILSKAGTLAATIGSILSTAAMTAVIIGIVGRVAATLVPHATKAQASHYKQSVPGPMQAVFGATFGSQGNASNVISWLQKQMGTGPGGQQTLPEAFGSGGDISGAWDTSYQHFQRDFAGKITAWFTQSLPHAFLSAIPGWWSTAYESFQRGFAGHLTTWFTQTLPAFFTHTIPDTSKTLVHSGETLISGLLSGATSWWPRFAKWVGSIGGRVISGLGDAGSWLIGKGKNVITGLLDGLEDRFPAATGWLGRVGGRVISALGDAGGWLYSKGHNVISGLLNGIRDEMSGIGSWIKKWVVDPIINAVKSFFGIHSPSTVMAGIGGHLVGGLLKGLTSSNLTGMIGKIFGSVPDALGAIVSKGLVSIASLPGKALSALGDLGGDVLNLLGLGGSSGGGGNASAQSIGKILAANRGWTGANWTALVKLWDQESGWRWNATNPSSGAYGIPQALPADKMASAGKDWRTNPWTQIRWGLSYIAGRYGSPLGAWAHEMAFNWYGHGGKFRAGQLIGVGDRGPELVSFDRAGQVFSPEQSAGMLGSPSFDVRVFIGDQELTGIVRTEIKQHDRQTMRAARAGTGRAAA